MTDIVSQVGRKNIVHVPSYDSALAQVGTVAAWTVADSGNA